MNWDHLEMLKKMDLSEANHPTHFQPRKKKNDLETCHVTLTPNPNVQNSHKREHIMAIQQLLTSPMKLCHLETAFGVLFSCFRLHPNAASRLVELSCLLVNIPQGLLIHNEH